VNLVMEPTEGDEMTRRPVALDEPLLTRALLRRLLVLTPAIVAVVLGWFAWRLHDGVALEVARSEAFTLLVICEWFNVLNCRSEHRSAFDRSVLRNPWLVAGLAAGNLLQVGVIFLPPANHIFHTTPFDLTIVFALGVVGSAVLWIEELRKLAAALQRRSA
jgi:Ca2+-transporting ATPase